MWSIEVSVNASEEEIEEALLEEVDFDYVRKCVAELKGIVEKYGPFKEIQEKNENSRTGEFVKTYHEKRGWICDALERIDSRKVWTFSEDLVNEYSYLISGYLFVGPKDRPSYHEIRSWFISEKSCEDSLLTVNTEFIIFQIFTDSDDDDDSEYYFRLNLWDLIEADNLSDKDIIGVMSS